MPRKIRRAGRKFGFSEPYTVVYGKAADRNDIIDYTAPFPYEDWMGSACLAMLQEKDECYRSAPLDIQIVEHKPVIPPLPTAYEICEPCMQMVSYLTPKAEPLKVRSEQSTLYIEYAVGATAFKDDYKNNGAELQKLKDILSPLTTGDLVTFKAINVCGYASLLQTRALRLFLLGTLALRRSPLPHLGTILGDLTLPRCGLLGGPHPQSKHSSKQRCGNQSKQRTEMQHKRAHQHDDCDHQHRDNNNPPSADRGTTKGTDMRDPFVGQLALMRLVGLHYCPFRLCGGLIGESRSAVGIHQMQRRRKAVLSVLDYPLHAFDRPFGQPESHENNHNRKHHNRA